MAVSGREDGLRSLLGLALRGRRLVLGRTACRRAAREGRLHLVLLAVDAGTTAPRDAGAGAGVQCLRLRQDKLELGEWLGRSTVAVVGVLDPHIAAGLLQASRPPSSP